MSVPGRQLRGLEKRALGRVHLPLGRSLCGCHSRAGTRPRKLAAALQNGRKGPLVVVQKIPRVSSWGFLASAKLEQASQGIPLGGGAGDG